MLSILNGFKFSIIVGEMKTNKIWKIMEREKLLRNGDLSLQLMGDSPQIYKATSPGYLTNTYQYVSICVNISIFPAIILMFHHEESSTCFMLTIIYIFTKKLDNIKKSKVLNKC